MGKAFNNFKNKMNVLYSYLKHWRENKKKSFEQNSDMFGILLPLPLMWNGLMLEMMLEISNRLYGILNIILYWLLINLEYMIYMLK